MPRLCGISETNKFQCASLLKFKPHYPLLRGISETNKFQFTAFLLLCVANPTPLRFGDK